MDVPSGRSTVNKRVRLCLKRVKTHDTLRCLHRSVMILAALMRRNLNTQLGGPIPRFFVRRPIGSLCCRSIGSCATSNSFRSTVHLYGKQAGGRSGSWRVFIHYSNPCCEVSAYKSLRIQPETADVDGGPLLRRLLGSLRSTIHRLLAPSAHRAHLVLSHPRCLRPARWGIRPVVPGPSWA